VSKVFADGGVALDGMTLEASDGELLVIVGPSGSGKSTLLRLVAGLEAVSEGRILLDGRDVTGLPPQDRDLAMVFQSYALYPHKTVRQNLAFGLRMRGADRDRIRERVMEVARTLEIEELLDRKPGALSGGQKQRVALGRAIAREPRAFLLDEPLSNLDPGLRVRTRTELARLQKRLRATALYVTHDQEEAMTLGHRVAVLRQGKLQQVAPPEELYRTPANRFVARFIGSPAMNLLPWTPSRPQKGGRRGSAPSGESRPPRGPERVETGVRPQDVEVLDPNDPRADAVGAVELVEELGSEARLHLRLEAPLEEETVVAVVPGGTRTSPGQRAALRFPRDRLHYFRVEDGARVEGPEAD